MVTMFFPTLTDGMHILEQTHAGFASDDGESRTKHVLGFRGRLARFELLQDPKTARIKLPLLR